MLLRFDCGLQQAGAVTLIRMSAAGILHCTEEITISIDNQQIWSIQNGSAGNIAQKYIDAVIARSA